MLSTTDQVFFKSSARLLKRKAMRIVILMAYSWPEADCICYGKA